MSPTELFLAAALCALAVAIVALLLRSRAQVGAAAELQRQLAAEEVRAARVPALEASLAAASGRAEELREQLARARTELEQERRQADEKLGLLRAARAEMSNEFRALAEDVMSRHGESFSRVNKEQMDAILAPLRDKLGEFERRVQESQAQSTAERATLAEQIRHVAETGAAMGKETRELTEALRGKSQTQGAWGEMVLSRVLERSGLRVGEEYAVQLQVTGEDGRRLRPDVVVNLPAGPPIVIDAKVSLKAFEQVVNAESREARAEHLKSHIGSLRAHVTSLASKEYQQAIGTALDYVLMFVPIEGALAAAVAADPELIAFAAERHVTITTPTTLMIALRTVANIWQAERRNRNADEIAERAGKLYDKFVAFVADMTSVGDSITKSHRCFDEAMGKLTAGRGNLVRQAEQLKAMGGRTAKALPPALLEAAEAQSIEKLVPQPQAEVAFGLRTVKCEPISSSV
jgi:DNA recombination protein RmuC